MRPSGLVRQDWIIAPKPAQNLPRPVSRPPLASTGPSHSTPPRSGAPAAPTPFSSCDAPSCHGALARAVPSARMLFLLLHPGNPHSDFSSLLKATCAWRPPTTWTPDSFIPSSSRPAPAERASQLQCDYLMTVFTPQALGSMRVGVKEVFAHICSPQHGTNPDRCSVSGV